MTNPPPDQGIPILTEVIGAQPGPAADIPAAPAPVRPTPSSVTPAGATAASFDTGARLLNAAQAMPRADVSAPSSAETPAVQGAGAWSNSELRDLEDELRLRITRQVLGRIDFVLDHRVRNTLTEIVDTAIDALAVEIKRGLHETLTDMVARAVAQEIARLQSAKK